LLLIALMVRMAGVGLRLYLRTKDTFFRGMGLGFCGLMVCVAVSNFFGDRWTFLQVDGFMWVLLGCVVRTDVLVSQSEAEPCADSDEHNQEAPAEVFA